MRTTYIHSQHSLPYGHVIQRIMKIHDILIPGDHNVLIPANLCWELINMGWIEKGIYGISHIISNDRPINKWIWEPNALPNQYWDPNSNDVEADSSVHDEPSQRFNIRSDYDNIGLDFNKDTIQSWSKRRRSLLHKAP